MQLQREILWFTVAKLTMTIQTLHLLRRATSGVSRWMHQRCDLCHILPTCTCFVYSTAKASDNPGLYLLWRAISWIQNGLIRDVVCATTQVCAGSQVNQLEPLLIVCKDDVHGLDISVYKPSCMEGLHGTSRSLC